MKNFILLLLFQLTLLAIGQPLKKLVDIDAPNNNIAHRRAHRYSRALQPDPPTCSLNQYFDEEEGRCLGVTGGGRVLYINSTNSCGINALQPHCTNPRYYYICKDNKTILAQCLQGQHFESRLQKCVNVDPDRLISSTVQPNLETFESIQLPECKKPGSFPVPDDCTLFYTCETNGHRMFHSIFRCPKDMAYNVETKMCSFSSSCKKENSAVSFCAPMITKEKRNVEKSTSTESLTHITDETTTYEISTTESLEDTTITNTVSVTTYDNAEPTSTFSFNDFTSTEFTEVTAHVDVTVSTERASSTLHSLDTETSTAYSATNEQELTSKEEMNLFTEITTVVDNTPETEKSVEGSTTEAVTETSIVDLITSNTEIQTTEISIVVTEKVVEESIVEVTEVTTASTMAPADLSTGSTEIQTTEITTETEMNDDESTSSEMEFTDSARTKSSNEEANSEPITLSNAAVTKESLNENENSNILSTISFNDAKTEPTFLSTITISTANSVQEPAANFNIKNISSTSTIVAVSNSENNKQNTTSKENDIREKEFVTMLKTIHSKGRVSADIILPIMSAVLSIIDAIERCLIDILSRVQS